MASEVGPAGLSHKNMSQVGYIQTLPARPWMLPNLMFLRQPNMPAKGHKGLSTSCPLYPRKRTLTGCWLHRPLCANSGHSAYIHFDHLIGGIQEPIFPGTVRPSALAVLRLMTNSNLVDCTTGKSPGFSPSRILPT